MSEAQGNKSGFERKQVYATANGVDDVTNSVGLAGDCKDKMFKFLHSVQGFVPLIAFIVATALDPFNIYIVAGAVLLFLNIFVLDLFLYKMGRTRNFPKIIDVQMFSVFLVVTIIVWALPEYSIWFKYHLALINSAAVTIVVAAAWALGYPMTRTVIADELDEVGLTHPLAVHFVKVTTGAFLGAFALSTIGFIPFSVFYDKGKEEASVISFIVGIVINIGSLIAAFIFASWYTRYVFYNADSLVQKHFEKDVIAWMEKHPEHEMTLVALKMEEAAADADDAA